MSGTRIETAIKKRNVINLIRHHEERNESAFRNEAAEIARDFDASGDGLPHAGDGAAPRGRQGAHHRLGSRWDYEADRYHGYGQVPIRIEDVVEAQNDEIRFFLTGMADEFLTYNYGIPVPIAKEKQPLRGEGDALPLPAV